MLNKAKAMIDEANLPYEMRHKLFQEDVMTVTKLDGLVIVIINKDDKTRCENFGNSVPKFVKHFRTWGEAEVVKKSSKNQKKLLDKVKTFMFVGDADQHHGYCYRIHDLNVPHIYLTRYVMWIKRIYYPNETQNNTNNEVDIIHVDMPL